MNGSGLLDAHVAKAQHAVRCKRAQDAVNVTLKALGDMVVAGGPIETIAELRARLIADFTQQLDLLISGPAINRAIKEAENG